MGKFLVLLGYIAKQQQVIFKLYEEIKHLDLSKEDKRYVFALKAQQLYTAIEDTFKQIAKVFENEIENLSAFHKELLNRMTISIPNVRISVISNESHKWLDKLRGFRHFIRHGYDYALDEDELQLLQNKLRQGYPVFEQDLTTFTQFIQNLVDSQQDNGN